MSKTSVPPAANLARPAERGRSALAWFLPAAVAALLLAARIAAVWPDAETVWHRAPRRFWEDMHVAIGYYIHGQFPVQGNWVVKERTATSIRFVEQHPHLTRTVADTGIVPWQFWRKVPSNRFRRHPHKEVSPRFDDSGRPLLLGLAFKARGGIMPFLIFWLAWIVSLPILAWTGYELHRAGWTIAGPVFLLLVGLSHYVAENLALPYSTTGFYLLGVLVLALVSVHALAPARGASYWLRLLAAGAVFALCALCRGGSLLLLPGFALAVGIAQARQLWPWRTRAVAWLASLALFLTPYAAARVLTTRLVARTQAAHGRAHVPQQHAFWFGLWGGLGDFDRSKGHVWSDLATWDAIVKAGGTPTTSTTYDPANEAILRRVILGEIRDDPAWYASILARRLWSALVQPKLWPWSPWGGQALAPARHPNEGAMDAYYSLTSTAEWFGVGRWAFELPMPLLLAPSALLLWLAWRRRQADSLLVLAPVLLAVLPLPILVTTASALEPQAVMLVYLLAAALAAQAIARPRSAGVFDRRVGGDRAPAVAPPPAGLDAEAARVTVAAAAVWEGR